MNPQHSGGDTVVNPQATASPHYKFLNPNAAETVVTVAPGAATGDIDEARRDATHALAHDLQFTLTIGEAQEMFRTLRRRAPSERSLQRYCKDMTIAAQVIHTSFGREWLLNETSLLRFIEQLPIMGSADNVAPQPPTATPAAPHVAITQQLPSDTTATADAGGAKTAELATLSPADDEDMKGEPRTRGQILAENARLLAIAEGKDAIIAELKEEQAFLREEVRDARTMRRDVTRISDKMLSVMQMIGTAGRALKAPEPADPLAHDDIEPGRG